MTKEKGMLTIVKLKKVGGFAKTLEVQRERECHLKLLLFDYFLLQNGLWNIIYRKRLYLEIV